MTQLAQAVLETKGDVVTVLSSDNRCIYIETNADAAVGGRTWDVFRVKDLNVGKFRSFARRLEHGGGLAQYTGNDGGNVCSSVCARAIEFGGGPRCQ